MMQIIYRWYTWLVAFFSPKRRNRLGEMRRHVEMIRDPHGCADALERFYRIRHLSDHYRLTLREAGFSSADGWSALRDEVDRSLSRARMRNSDVRSDILDSMPASQMEAILD